MPIPSPFHERTLPLAKSMAWKDWAGYHAVTRFSDCHEPEYMALRHAAGLQDVTPLYKYEVRGRDAGRFLDRILVRRATKMKVGQVAYTCWCDQFGKVLDDGTVSRLDKDWYRLTAAEPCMFWFDRFRQGFRDLEVVESTHEIGVLSLQGPRSRAILEQVTDVDMASLKFFRTTTGELDGVDVRISRTGYTGDLGYEVWVDAADGVKVWDALVDAGKDHGLKPNGLDALDVCRVEAGFVMNGVDYWSAHQCLIESRKSTPYEIGLGWTVKLKDRPGFAGMRALLEEQRRGPELAFVGLEIDWVDLETRYAAHDLPPELPAGAWREPHCLYDIAGVQVGRVTSGTWSPILKKNLALATVRAPYAEPGTELRIEWMIEWERVHLRCWVRETPFFDPERKRA